MWWGAEKGKSIFQIWKAMVINAGDLSSNTLNKLLCGIGQYIWLAIGPFLG